MLQASPQVSESRAYLRRLVNFADPRPDDVCLDVVDGASSGDPAIADRVRDLTRADVSRLPDGPFSLVIARQTLARAAEPVEMLREMLRVCGGRLVTADLVRTRGTSHLRDQLERLRDPGHTSTPTLPELIELARQAGGQVRRLDVFTIEQPMEPWLASASDPDRIRREVTAEVDGGPPTGARPRVIGGELWFSQSWAHIAVHPC